MNAMHATFPRATSFLAALLVGACVFAMCAGDAMAQRRGGGGGARGGGGGGSHGGRMAQSSVSGGNRGGSRSSGSGARSSGSSARSGGYGGSGSRSADRGGSGDRSSSRSIERTRTSGDRETNIGSNNNVNIEGRDVNIDVEGGWGGGYNGFRHPVAAGITIGAIATSAAVAAGSYYYALPSNCALVGPYYQCGSAYYQEAMDGDTVVYVSVEQ